MNRHALIDRIRKNPNVGTKTFGVVASYGKVTEIDEDGEKNDIIAIANTGDIDLDDEVVIPEGAERDYIEKNRQVFVDHNYGINDAAGVIRSMSLKGGEWRVRIRLYDNEAGRAVKAIARSAGQIGLSIGFFILYYMFLIGGENMADRMLVAPWLSMWAPNIVLGIMGVALFRYAARR